MSPRPIGCEERATARVFSCCATIVAHPRYMKAFISNGFETEWVSQYVMVHGTVYGRDAEKEAKEELDALRSQGTFMQKMASPGIPPQPLAMGNQQVHQQQLQQQLVHLPQQQQQQQLQPQQTQPNQAAAFSSIIAPMTPQRVTHHGSWELVASKRPASGQASDSPGTDTESVASPQEYSILYFKNSVFLVSSGQPAEPILLDLPINAYRDYKVVTINDELLVYSKSMSVMKAVADVIAQQTLTDSQEAQACNQIMPM